MKIKLKKQQAEFLKMCSSCIKTGNNDVFYYMPFWWKEIDGVYNLYDMMSFDSIPDELKSAIRDFHENGFMASPHTIHTAVGNPATIDVSLESKGF
jgi:TRAP-type mannitol/chloroaromatic compound transport system substrate-binding protein